MSANYRYIQMKIDTTCTAGNLNIRHRVGQIQPAIDFNFSIHEIKSTPIFNKSVMQTDLFKTRFTDLLVANMLENQTMGH